MELILKQDVTNLGFKDDVVTVKGGYGRNYLIPQGYAVLATPSAKKALEETLKQKAYKEKKIVEEAKEIAKTLKALSLKLAKKVSGEGKLFGSVTPIDLAEVLAGQNITVDKKYITISGGSVKAIGKYQATIRLHRGVVVELQFEVIPEK